MNDPPAEKFRRILIIDDNRSIHEDFRKILGAPPVQVAALEESESLLFGLQEHRFPRIPCEIDSAYQGRDGVALVRRALTEGRPYAIAFVDIRMPPGWDGVETTREIWAADPDVQIVICTAYSDYSWDEMFGKIGNCDNLVILKKPFDTVEALQLAHALSEKWWLHRQSVRKMDELESIVADRIRELRDTNKALHRQQTELRVLFDYLPAMICFKDTENGILRVNKQLADAAGKSVEEIEGRSVVEIFPDEAARYYANDLEVIRSGLPKLGIIEKDRDRDGNEISIQTDLVPVRDAHGKVAGIVVMAQDISERIRTEESLRQSEALLRIAGRTARLGGWAVDLPDLHVTWSDEMCTIHEVLPGTRLGSDEAFRFIAPQSREVCRIAFENCARDATPFDLEMDVVTSGGREIRVRATGEARRDAAGGIDGVHGACQDITERTKLAEQFLRAQRMESIGTLAGGIAHDLNNVLAPILMSIELLKLKENDQGRLNILSIIQKSTRRGADMVAQVLSFARGVKGEPMQVSVGHLLDEIEKIVRDTFPKNIEVRSHIPADLWAVQGDATQLHQVLLNLCVNARDAMPDGGSLTLSAKNLHLDDHYAALNEDARPGPYVFIEVEDSGTGIPPEIIGEIFDPFFTTKEVGKGTGLGLSTSLAILKSHGGFIRAYSEPGKGTRFQINLPALAGTVHAEITESPVDLPRGNGELILVVDDEVAVRQITQKTLEAFGYRVVLASDGAESVAIFALRHAEIAAIITDMMMPVMDGPATIQVLQRIDPSVPIIAASGLAAKDRSDDAARTGVKCFLLKPYTAETLLTTLDGVLSGKI